MNLRALSLMSKVSCILCPLCATLCPSAFLAGSPFTTLGPVSLVSDANDALLPYYPHTQPIKNKKDTKTKEQFSNLTNISL